MDLAARNPAPFAAYIDAGDFQVVSASPERLVSVVGDRARSSPIKGTRPRGDTPEEDERPASDLISSPKDRAENVMIADLGRNDLGRACEAGSVRAETLCALERSEEHTSELQSRENLVCRLLLEKKKRTSIPAT